MKFTKWLALLLVVSSTAHASGTRTLDGALITNGAATLTLPTATDTILGRTTTDTLTNKSISGSTNTFTAIPAGTALSGTVPKANGGTAQDNSSLTFPSTGTVPAFTPTNHGVVISGSGAAATVTSAGTSGQVLTSNGAAADPTYQTPASTAPTLNGTQAAPSSITAGTGIVLSAPTYFNVVWVVGNGGAVTVTATPSITACTADGQRLVIIGTSNTNTVTLNDEATTAGSDLRLNGPWVGAQHSVLELICANVGVAAEWNEVARR